MNKFEKLIEYIINDEDQKARELFHSIVVEKSRDICESIMDEEQMEETVHGQPVEDMVDEISHEEAVGEDDEEGAEFELGGEEPAGEEEFGDGVASDEFGGEESSEDKILNIDAKLDELLAKFDEIMGDDGSSAAEEPAFDSEEEMDAEEVPAEEPQVFEGENPFAKSGKSGKSGSGTSAKSGVSGKSGSGFAASGKSGNPFAKKTESKQSTTELMREYVDKIGDIYGGTGDAAEGTAVGAAGKRTAVNTKPGSVGPGANFGGSTATPKGGVQNQDGGSPTKANNEYTKGQSEIKSGNRNVPGGKAGNPESTGREYTKDAKGAEGKTTDGTVPVAKKSVQVQNTGKK